MRNTDTATNTKIYTRQEKKTMKVISKTIQILTTIIAVLAIVMFIVPIALGIRPFIVLSGSMEPTIKTGSIVYINTNVYSYEIEKNDIIAFKMNRQTVTHRVIEVNKDDESFITKGDANEERDAVPVSFINYRGKTIFSIPYLGRTVAFFKSAFGLFCLVALILVNMFLIIVDKDDDDEEIKSDKDKAYEK